MVCETRYRKIILGLSITGFLFGSLFNPMHIISGLGLFLNTILEPVHLMPTVKDEIESARYTPGDPYTRYFDQIIGEGKPYLSRKAPLDINENIYIAMLDNGNLLADYQINIVHGKAICYGKTPRTGGNASCGNPTIWIKVDKYAVREIAETQGFKSRAYLVKDLFLAGHIDVYPKSKAFDYLGMLPKILELARNAGLQ